MLTGENELSLEELEKLLNDEGSVTPPASNDATPPAAQPANDDDGDSIEKTKAFAKRLAEKSAKEAEKARLEERDKIAKELGYESYDDMTKKREAKLLEDKGYNPEELAPVVEELVKKRLSEDPRMKELEMLKQKQIQEFAQKELAEISKLTNGEITSMEQVPADVLERWKQTGSLKQAYIALHGEELIIKARSAASKGSTDHLQNPAGAPPTITNERPMTQKEKDMYKFFNPNTTQEELDKMRVKN